MSDNQFCNLSNNELMDISAGGTVDSALRIGLGGSIAAGGCGAIYAGATATGGSVVIAGVSVASGLVIAGGVVAVCAGVALIGYGIWSLFN